MFLGVLPPDVLQQFLGSIRALPHDDVYVCCSGTFRMERALARSGLNVRIHSNDVSLYSCAIGRWLAGERLDYTFKGELEPLELLLQRATPRRRAAGVIVALDMARYGKGKDKNAFNKAH